MMASSKLRTFFSLLLSILNLLLFLLSSASFVPLFLLRTPPTLFGWALFAASVATLFSSLLSFYSHRTTLLFISYISLALTSSIGEALGFLALLRTDDTLLGSARSAADGRVLIMIEEWMLLGMLVVQSVVLVSACVVERSWVREYQGMEAKREVALRKMSRRMARVHNELVVHAVAMARELDEKVKIKNGQCGTNLKDTIDELV